MASSLQAIFNPRRIAVIGAAQDPNQVRGRLVDNLKISGFGGDILPIHPRHAEIQGLRAYPRVADAGPGIDLAIVAVPSDSLIDVLRECGEAGVKGAAVVSGLPAGTAGARIQAEAGRVARETGLRVIGPNCLGFFLPFGKLAATFSPLTRSQFPNVAPQSKRVSIISQSGGMGLQIFEMCADAGLNVVQVLMSGNEADVDVVELLDHAVGGGEVDVVLMYIEGIKNGARFIRAANRAAEAGIPVIALKVGKSSTGSRAAITHTAHLTGSDAVYEAIFHRCGVTRVYDPDAMVALASVMARRARMGGRRVGIVSSGGGHAVMWTDLCEMNGLPVPPLSAALCEHLATFIPSHGSADNPVDTAGVTDDLGLKFCRAIEALVTSDEVDAVLGTCHFGMPGMIEKIAPYLQTFAACERKPIVLASSAVVTPATVRKLQGMGIQLLTLAAATQSLKALADYGDFLRRHRLLTSGPVAAAGGVAAAAMDLATREGQFAFLHRHGVPLPVQRLADSENEACAAAQAIGWPVVMKIESPTIPHKTEAGGVRLGIADEAAVRAAFRELMGNARVYAPAARLDGVLVQEMAPRGRELIVGTTTDDTFGPMLVVGFGGIYAEVLKDVVLAPLPVDRQSALEMIHRLRGIEILEGARGEMPADLEAVAQLLAAVSDAVMESPSIIQLDLNPVVVYPQGGRGCLALDTLFVLNATR